MLGVCKFGSNGFKLNGVPLQEMECFKYLGSQVVADGGSEMDVDHVLHIMNEGYKAWGH